MRKILLTLCFSFLIADFACAKHTHGSTITNGRENSSATLLQGDLLELGDTYIRKNTHLKADIRCKQFDQIDIGRGIGMYQGYHIVITQDSLFLHQCLSKDTIIYRNHHGLTPQNRLTVSIDYTTGNTASLVLKSKGNQHTEDIRWWAGGKPFLQNLGEKEIDCTLSFTPSDCQHSIWIIGDSYINWLTPMRWPYYLFQQGYQSWMADHIPGGHSDLMLQALKHDLRFGCPKFAVWTLGMNDASDKDAPNAKWLSCVQEFLSLCRQNGIIPILSTIPSVPNRNHRFKSAWVRQSGVRYIDFSAAVSDNDAPQWFPDMLYKDMVHPSAKGAQALAERVLEDLPEIKY